MMKASALEFRFRFLIHGLIYLIGFVAPWNYVLHYDTIRTWQLLAANATRQGWLGFGASTVTFLMVGIVLAFMGALVRTWGTAYMGAGVVNDGALHGDSMVAAGPYRFVRNPLYLGTFLHTLALVLLMVPTGTVFTIVAIAVVQLRLIGAEEAFLPGQLGEAYAAYCAKVPRLLPALTPRVAASAVRPEWVSGFLGEIYFWGTAVSFAVAGWRYNAQLVLQGVIISLGVSLVARAFVGKKVRNAGG
jgi:protein-S-isoprenylcysteine O-methyltransferase Ste14